MKTISLTIPMDYNALTHACDMLHGLAVDLKRKSGGSDKTRGSEAHAATPEAGATIAPSIGAPTTAVDPQYVTEPAEPAATEVFGDQQSLEAPNGTPFAETTTSATATAAPAGVNLAPATTNPEVSIPWDARINAGSKAKLAKAPHGWKMKRGVAADLVATVEADLIAAMSASPASPVTPNEPAPAPAPSPAQPAAAPAGAVSTFPELMAKITASGIDQATVAAAVNKQGLQALPLLAARSDLIPAVAAELFPGD